MAIVHGRNYLSDEEVKALQTDIISKKVRIRKTQVPVIIAQKEFYERSHSALTHPSPACHRQDSQALAGRGPPSPRGRGVFIK